MKYKKYIRIKKNNLIIFLLTILFLCTLILSLHRIVSHEIDLKENAKVIEKTNKYVTKDKIDFNSLKKQNPDTIGHIKVNNTNIDYVVVKTTDNEFYLRHNFNKEKNIAGWIFVDYRNNIDGLDKGIKNLLHHINKW